VAAISSRGMPPSSISNWAAGRRLHACAAYPRSLPARIPSPVWCGGMLEFRIIGPRPQHWHSRRFPNFTCLETSPRGKRYWSQDIIEPEVTVSKQGGYSSSQWDPGIGLARRAWT